MTEKSSVSGLAKLLEPFKPNEINQLPKPYKKDSQAGKCPECGGWHGLPALHLEYLGHAALTKRFLEVDPLWYWEPVAFGEDGLPKFDHQGGLWIRLYICGHSRLGYGDSQGKTGPNATKEAIGDALRNAGMRFGAALDLWHKGDLYDAKAERGDETVVAPPAPKKSEPTPARVYTEEEIAQANVYISLASAITKLPELKAFNNEHKDYLNVPVGKKTLGSVILFQKELIEKAAKNEG